MAKHFEINFQDYSLFLYVRIML